MNKCSIGQTPKFPRKHSWRCQNAMQATEINGFNGLGFFFACGGTKSALVPMEVKVKVNSRVYQQMLHRNLLSWLSVTFGSRYIFTQASSTQNWCKRYLYWFSNKWIWLSSSSDIKCYGLWDMAHIGERCFTYLVLEYVYLLYFYVQFLYKTEGKVKWGWSSLTILNLANVICDIFVCYNLFNHHKNTLIFTQCYT